MIQPLQRSLALMLAALMLLMALPVGSMELREALDHHEPQAWEHSTTEAALHDGPQHDHHDQADNSCSEGHCCSDICTATPIPTLITALLSATPSPVLTSTPSWDNLTIARYRPPRHV